MQSCDLLGGDADWIELGLFFVISKLAQQSKPAADNGHGEFSRHNDQTNSWMMETFLNRRCRESLTLGWKDSFFYPEFWKKEVPNSLKRTSLSSLKCTESMLYDPCVWYFFGIYSSGRIFPTVKWLSRTDFIGNVRTLCHLSHLVGIVPRVFIAMP